MFLITGLLAQTVKKDAFYLSFEGILGNYSGATIGLNYMSKQKLAFHLGIHSLGNKSDQYQGETFFGREYDATKEFYGFHFLVGKVLTWDAPARFILSGGVGSTKIKKPVSTQSITLHWIGLHSTSVQYEESQFMTYIFNPKIEIPVSKIFGVSLTSHLMANKEDVAFGIGIGFILGALK